MAKLQQILSFFSFFSLALRDIVLEVWRITVGKFWSNEVAASPHVACCIFMPVVCYVVSILLSPVCLFAQAAVYLCFSGVWLIALKFV